MMRLQVWRLIYWDESRAWCNIECGLHGSLVVGEDVNGCGIVRFCIIDNSL